jgi:hypothetical protein
MKVKMLKKATIVVLENSIVEIDPAQFLPGIMEIVKDEVKPTPKKNKIIKKVVEHEKEA